MTDGKTETLRTLWRAAADRLQQAGVDSARLDARLLVGSGLRMSRTDMLTSPDRPVTPAECAAVDRLVARRANREPLSRIMGIREFWSLEFHLNASTLDPRPDTETVVEAALTALPDRTRRVRLLDLGTGTGCILIALLTELPNAAGLGIDASAEAVVTAAANATRLGVGHRSRFQVGDWTRGLNEAFDLVVANPPYIPSGDISGLEPEVSLHDPVRALDGGADGLEAFRRIAAGLRDVLAPGGLAVFEMGAGQAAAVSALFEQQGFGRPSLVKDLSGRDRCAVINNLR